MNENKEYYKFNNEKIENNNDKNDNKINIIYKFKLGIYCFIFFILLSNKNTYKILDIIVKIFRKDSNDIIDSDNNPQLFGSAILALIFAILIIFIG